MLLCAPSLGILDNWLPVLHAARASHPDWRIVALIPDRETLAQLDPSDTAHVLADDVIDATVAPLRGGGWVLADGFLDAGKIATPRRLFRCVPTRAQRASSIDPSALAGRNTRLLYDVHLHEKQRLQPLLTMMGDTPRFSHNHGLTVEAVGERSTTLTTPALERRVYTYSPVEASAYVENFGLPSHSLRCVGVVRHDTEWVDRIVKRSSLMHHIPFQDYAFIISRPAGSSYLPPDRKVDSLRALYRVFWEELGLPLLLRAHPKESEDGTILRSLPQEEEGKSWALSKAHPLHIGQGARVAVTFFSGVVIDMLHLGIPTLEMLDVRGLPEHDNPTSPRDSSGRPLFGAYRKHDLVIPVDDPAELREKARSVLVRPQEAMQSNLAAYRRIFPLEPNVIDSIVADFEQEPPGS